MRWPPGGRARAWHSIEELFTTAGFAIGDIRRVSLDGYEDWKRQGRPPELRAGKLHLAGNSSSEIEQFYVYQYLVSVTPDVASSRRLAKDVRQRTDVVSKCDLKILYDLVPPRVQEVIRKLITDYIEGRIQGEADKRPDEYKLSNTIRMELGNERSDDDATPVTAADINVVFE